LLKRALENFLMNAVNHNPIGTMITITLERLEKETMIEISDNGIGMDRKMLKRLFNQYYRGTSTDKTHLGSGLGMSIAKQFIEKQNGEVHVISEKNKGTKIIIKFPN
jgi:signal transduction histidine kinase